MQWHSLTLSLEIPHGINLLKITCFSCVKFHSNSFLCSVLRELGEVFRKIKNGYSLIPMLKSKRVDILASLKIHPLTK